MGIHLGLRWWIFDPNPALRVQVRTASELVYGLFASAGMWRREVAGELSYDSETGKGSGGKSGEWAEYEQCSHSIYLKLNSALVTVSTGHDDVSSIG